MNRLYLRTRLQRELDHAATSSTLMTTRLNASISDAIREMMDAEPSLFFVKEAYLPVLPDANMYESTDTVSVVTNDPWTLKRDTIYLLLKDSVADPNWKTDRTWDGRFILVTTAAGDIHIRRIRTIWELENGQQYLTLDAPWPNVTDEGMSWVIYSESYPLPRDFGRFDKVAVVEDGSVLHNLEPAAYNQLQNASNRIPVTGVASGGRPNFYARGIPFNVPAPARALTATTGSGYTWDGQNRTGKFDYKWTICYGRRSGKYRLSTPEEPSTSARGRYAPLWESAPSPESGTVIPVRSTTAVELTLPSLDYQLGFELAFSSPPKRENKSGFYARLYRRRLTDTDSSSGLLPAKGDYNEATWDLLDEIPFGAESYVDDGTLTADPFTHPPRTGSVSSLMLHPRPDKEYLVRLTYLPEPDDLQYDTDTVNLQEHAVTALMALIRSYYWRMADNDGKERKERTQYEMLMNNLRMMAKGYPDPSVPVMRVGLRGRRGHRYSPRIKYP